MRARIGDYEVEDFGAGGVVRYAATHVLLPRRAVIEMLDPAEPRSKAVKMMRQACVLEALRHPGVPRVYECGLLDGRPWIAFEHLEGVSLGVDMLSRKLPACELLDMIDHVAAILADAHARGVLHRDMNPGVILRCQNRGYPYALDGWASACTLDTELANPLKGSHRYRAPELVDEKPADGRADIYALGTIAYEVLTGELPVPGAADEIPGVSTSLSRLVAAMVTLDPTRRPTAAEVRRAIRDIRDEPAAEYDSIEIAMTATNEMTDMALDDSIVIDQATDEVIQDVLGDVMNDVMNDVMDYIAEEPPAFDPPPRAKPRWTPPWGLEDRNAVAPCVVEIMPRGRPDPRRDD